MPIVTLTTDLGLNDHYVGAVKGAILSLSPDITIVDITHNIPAFNILQAAFTLKNSFHFFPKGTIHIMGVNPEADEGTDHLAILYKEHYFIGANNGVFSLIFDQKPEKVVQLNFSLQADYLTFPTKDIFTRAACHIANGGTLELIGKPLDHILERTNFQAVSVGNIIKGMIIHIDHYGNIITNVEENFFTSFAQKRNFMINLRSGDYDINSISKAYNDVPEGEKLALFSSSGLLEIAINKGNASSLLGMKYGHSIMIEFNDN